MLDAGEAIVFFSRRVKLFATTSAITNCSCFLLPMGHPINHRGSVRKPEFAGVVLARAASK